MSPVLRPFQAADAPWCARMVVDSEVGRRYGFTIEGLTGTLAAAQASGGELFVADVDGVAAGFAWIDPTGAFSSAPYLRLIAVNPQLRGAGVGAALLAEFERRTATVGRPWCLLVSEFNQAAQAFYAKHGYVRCGGLPDFARPGITEVLMVKARSSEALTTAALAQGAFGGAVLRVETPAGVAIERAQGWSGTASLTTSCRFDIASLTKLFTTTAVLRLVTLGRLRLEDTLEPWFAGADVRAALGHSTGFRAWYPFYTRRGEDFEALLASVLKESPPSGQTLYSDLNFMVLGKRIERTTGLPLEQALRELVLSPLGLAATAFGPVTGEVAPTERGNRIERAMVEALGLSFDGWRDEGTALTGSCNDGNAHYYFGGIAGHAGLFSNAGDLCALGRLYLDGGRWNGEPFLDPALVAEACRDHGAGRGLGFQFGDAYPAGGFGHTGFTGTLLYLNPGRGLVAALLTNRLAVESPRKITEFQRQVAQAVLSESDRSG